MDFSSPERVWRSELEGELSWMRVLARRLVHGEEEASELVQETWLAALSRPPGDRGRPRAWLRTVMANLARQRGRRAWVRRRTDLPELDPVDPGPGPGSAEEQEELEELLLSELATLDEPYRTTLEHHYLRGLQLVQIARRDGVPEGTVRWRLKTGIERLRQRLDDRYGDRRRWLAAFLPCAGPRRPRVEPLPVWPLAVAAGGLVVALAVVLLWRPWEAPEARPSEPAVAVAPAPETVPPHARPALEFAPRPEPVVAPGETLPAGGGFELTVRVVDAVGVSVAGAEVAVWSGSSFEARARTDASGNATVRAAPSEVGALAVPFARDRIVVRAASAGHATSEAAFLRAGAVGSLELALRGPERVLRGRVSTEDEQPLADVHVHAVLDPTRTSPASEDELFFGPLSIGTRSAADGSYELRGLERRPYAIVVTRAGCEPSLRLIDEDKEELPLVFVSDGRVRGRIVDEHGQPAAGARVWADPLYVGTDWCAGVPGYVSARRGFVLETVADADGRYELFDLFPHPRTRRLCAELAGPEPAIARGQVPVTARRTLDWSVFLARERGFRLHLVDEDGNDLAGWVAVLVGRLQGGGSWTRALVADAGGRLACFEGPDEAELLVYGPSGQGEPRSTRRLQVAEAEQTILVATETTTHLVGRIPTEYLAADPEARVIAFHLDSRQPFTLELDRASGRFKAELDAAAYALFVSGQKGAAWLTDVTLARGERRRLGKLVLPETGHVLLRADRDARAGNWRLELCFARSSMKWREGALPLFEERELLAGLYRLDAAGAGGVLESAWFQVEPGRSSELDLGRLARVELEVRPPRDGIARRLRLVAFPSSDGPAGRAEARLLNLQTRVDGSHRHALRLPEGAWLLELHDENGLVHRAALQVPSSGERRVEVDLGS